MYDANGMPIIVLFRWRVAISAVVLAAGFTLLGLVAYAGVWGG